MKQDLEQALRERIRSRIDFPSPAQCRALRIAAKLTQQEIADAVGHGCNQSLIATYEAGRCTPGPKHRERYAAVLRILAEVTR